MKTIAARKVAALVFALFIAGGSLASAGGPVNFGESKGSTINGGAVNFGV
ncbi:hypothetical protein [Deinococcus sp. DB0503]|nr:hypothetical protein [Deinococcus sp. DB0503]